MGKPISKKNAPVTPFLSRLAQVRWVPIPEPLEELAAGQPLAKQQHPT